MIIVAAVAILAINLATYAAFGWDKAAARRRERRIPERTLLTLAALGGGPAALLARQTLRHKTRKQPFGAWLMLIVFLQAVVVIVGAVLLNVDGSPFGGHVAALAVPPPDIR